MWFDIRPGTEDEVNQESGCWLFVDIGFSSTEKSCGVLKHQEIPQTMKFGCLLKYVVNETQTPGPPLNLLLEAPLSVAFDKKCNPTRRSTDVEKDIKGKSDYRDWWYNAGAATLLATGHLLRRVKESGIQREVRLFEGFASFKSFRPKWQPIEEFSKSDWPHIEDLLRLQCTVSDPAPEPGMVIPKEKLIVEGRECLDILECAFKFAGMDFDVPTVIKACKCTQDEIKHHLRWPIPQ